MTTPADLAEPLTADIVGLDVVGRLNMEYIWPPADLIIQSMNARANVFGKIGDDPLMGVAITPEMIERAFASQRRALGEDHGG